RFPSNFTLLFHSLRDHRLLPSFPTRRSSDLVERLLAGGSRRHEVGEPLRIGVQAGFGLRRQRDDEGTFRLLRRAVRGHVLFHDEDRKSTRLNSSHLGISYAVFCLKKKKINEY